MSHKDAEWKVLKRSGCVGGIGVLNCIFVTCVPVKWKSRITTLGNNTIVIVSDVFVSYRN